MIATNLALPSQWGEYGLAGLVIGSLFLLVYSFLSTLRSKDSSHQKFIKELLDDDRIERREDRREHREINNKLASAIEDLTEEIRQHNTLLPPHGIEGHHKSG